MMGEYGKPGNTFSIRIEPDEDGFVGKECPNPDCRGYFKAVPGTGIADTPNCHCPYCGHTAPNDQFFTKEQIEYAQSVVVRGIMGDLQKRLKKLEFVQKPSHGFGIGVSLQVKTGSLPPIHYYREKRLETEVVCDSCTLRYSVYGVFAFCRDCGCHNSLQVLNKNLELVDKMLEVAADMETDMAKRLIENALEDCVSAFDGFGREICRIHAKQATDPPKAERVSFQNLDGARRQVNELFGFDIAVDETADEWEAAVRSFQKRHLLAHKMGVADQEYVKRTGDRTIVKGQRIVVTADEVRSIARLLAILAEDLMRQLSMTNGENAP